MMGGIGSDGSIRASPQRMLSDSLSRPSPQARSPAPRVKRNQGHSPAAGAASRGQGMWLQSLWLEVPRRHGNLSGALLLANGVEVGGMPVWCSAERDPPLWLYSDPDGGWSVADTQAAFTAGGGLIASTCKHHGKPPHRVEEWSMGDGTGWRPLPGVSIRTYEAASRSSPTAVMVDSVDQDAWPWRPGPARSTTAGLALPLDGFLVDYPRGYDANSRLSLSELRLLKRVYEQECWRLSSYDPTRLQAVLREIGVGVHVDLNDFRDALTDAKRMAREAAVFAAQPSHENLPMARADTCASQEKKPGSASVLLPRVEMTRVVSNLTDVKSGASPRGISNLLSDPARKSPPKARSPGYKREASTFFSVPKVLNTSMTFGGTPEIQAQRGLIISPAAAPSPQPAPPPLPDGSGPGRKQPLAFSEFLMLCDILKAKMQSAEERAGDIDTLEAFVAMGGDKDKSGEVGMGKLRSTTGDFALVLDEAILEEVDKNQSGTVDFREFASLLSFDAAGDAIDCFAMAGGDPTERNSKVPLPRLLASIEMLRDAGAVPISVAETERAAIAARAQFKNRPLDFVDFLTALWQPAGATRRISLEGKDTLRGIMPGRGQHARVRHSLVQDGLGSPSSFEATPLDAVRRQTIQRARDASRAVAALLRRRESVQKPESCELQADILTRRFNQLCRRLHATHGSLPSAGSMREKGSGLLRDRRYNRYGAAVECTLMEAGLGHLHHVDASILARFVQKAKSRLHVLRKERQIARKDKKEQMLDSMPLSSTLKQRRNSQPHFDDPDDSDDDFDVSVVSRLILALAKTISLLEDHDANCPVCAVNLRSVYSMRKQPRKLKRDELGDTNPQHSEAGNTTAAKQSPGRVQFDVQGQGKPTSSRSHRIRGGFEPAPPPPSVEARVCSRRAVPAGATQADLTPRPVYVTITGSPVPLSSPPHVPQPPSRPRAEQRGGGKEGDDASSVSTRRVRSFQSRAADSKGEVNAVRRRVKRATRSGQKNQPKTEEALSPLSQRATQLLRDTCEGQDGEEEDPPMESRAEGSVEDARQEEGQEKVHEEGEEGHDADA
eukprot:Hpha_TRINITY_DN30702_c0_g1::TRINITY_DN30702_c0_g1_i1::g.28352::m.28352